MEDFSQHDFMETGDGTEQLLPNAPDRDSYLDKLRRRIQLQKGLVMRLSREDLEDQYLRLLEELEVVKKEGNVKDDYIKRLTTKVIRLERNDVHARNVGLSTSVRTQLEHKIRTLESQLRVAKVYGNAAAPMGKRISRSSSTANVANHQQHPEQNSQLVSRIDAIKQQLRHSEEHREKENEEHESTIEELRKQVSSLTDKLEAEKVKTSMAENMEITKLTRQLAKVTQELNDLRNSSAETKAKLDELKIKEMVATRDNERLKQEVDRHLATIDSLEKQARELREKALQNFHDKERISRLETEVDWYKRHQQSRTEQPSDPVGRVAESVLRNQIRVLEDELERETRDNKEVRRRLTDRELDIEKHLKELSQLRAQNVELRHEVEELGIKLKDTTRPEPKESEGWFRLPPAYRRSDLEHAFRLYDAFSTRRSISTLTDPSDRELYTTYKASPEVTAQIDQMKRETERISKELKEAQEELEKANRSTKQKDTQDSFADLERKVEEKSRQLSQKNRVIENLERHLREFAEGTVAYQLDDHGSGQNGSETVHLQHGDNLLELHFGPISLSKSFMEHAKLLRISKWQLTWSVFGENLFSQDSKGAEPDFDFTALHCITMDEQIMSDLSEGLIKVELTGFRKGEAYPFAFGAFGCQTVLLRPSKSSTKTRGELQMQSHFNAASGTSCALSYWFRMKFDVQQCQALYMARKKALNYLSKIDNGRSHSDILTSADQLWLDTNGPNANILHVAIHSCSGVKAVHVPGIPDCSALYQFYTSKMTETPVVKSSNDPSFEHRSTFRVTMTSDLDQYLETQKLEVYVIDARDRNQRHYIGRCDLLLKDLLQGSVRSKTLTLFSDQGQENGHIVVSLNWERSYKLRTRPSSATPRSALYSARNRRASMTPRGSLIAISQSARQKMANGDRKEDFRPPTREAQSGNVSEKNEDQPVAPPRKRSARASSYTNLPLAADRMSDSRKGNDYFSPPSTSNKSAEKQRSAEANLRQSPTSAHYDSVPKTGPSPLKSSFRRNTGSFDLTGSIMDREIRRNASEPVVGILCKEDLNSVRRFTVASPMAMKTNERVVEAELHHHSGDGISNGRKTSGISVTSARRRTPRSGRLSSSNGHLGDAVEKPGRESVTVVVHSLSFLEGAPVFEETAAGEIFVVYEFLAEEHESPLAVRKPSKANEELLFEFRKVFPMNAVKNGDARRSLAEMLKTSPPGRIFFSVYFQPDDESRDCELIGVAALSINRLLTNEQDAEEVDLKLMDPTTKGVSVGCITVTVRAIKVLLDLKNHSDI